MLNAMQFKTFVWPHNPKHYAIRFERSLVIHKLPLGEYTVEDLGRTARILEGSGEFYGEDAYETFKKLASLHYQKTPGLLIHPLWQSSSVCFERLSLLEEPRENYVQYAFRFVETNETVQQTQSEQPKRLILSAGQTLWDVCRQYGVSTEALLERNPQLTTCNDAETGEAVYLP